jgi:predicted nucleotidyltransferase
MRLTPEQVSTIIQTTRSIAGQDAKVWLYGSRLDDTRRGGDIDLLIESEPFAGLIARARIKNRIEQILQLPVDVLAIRNGVHESPFVAIARMQAIPLDCE